MKNMFIVEAMANRAWISGIFMSDKAVEQYWEEIPEFLRANQRIIEIATTYPFYVIEKEGFIYMGYHELIQILNDLQTGESCDDVYFNLYFITEDFRPSKPGTDGMGMLKHDHVNKNFMEHFREDGALFLKRRRLL